MMPKRRSDDQMIVRTAGTRWSPCVKSSMLKAGDGLARPAQPLLALESCNAGTVSVPRNAWRAGAVLPIGMK
jgi:hypothetical protein